MKKMMIICLLVSVVLVSAGIYFMMQEQPADSNKKDNEVVEEGEMDVLEKVNHLEKYFLSRLPIDDVNSISNQDKLNFAFFCLTSEELTSIPDSKIKDVLALYFGDEYQFTNENVLNSTGEEVVQYDSQNKEYVFKDNSSFSNSDPSLDLLSYTEYQNNDNQFEVYRQYLYVDNSVSPYNLYSTYQDYLNKVNSIGTYDISTTNNMLVSSVIDNYKDSLPVVTYSFHKEDYKYVLTSIILN